MSMRLIFVPRDAGALAVGADEVARRCSRSPNSGASRSRSSGPARAGLYWLEPMVEVATPQGRIAFGPVTRGRRRLAADRDGRQRMAPPAAARSDRRDPLAEAADPPHLRPLRRDRSAFAGRLPRPWRLQGPGACADARCGCDPRRGHAPRACAAAAARAFRPASSGRRSRRRKADRKFIVCNADEGDSGTFADRMIMEGDPFLLIEGMTIAGIASGATKGYIYIRSEYPHAIAAMNAAIAIAARGGGYLGRQDRRVDLQISIWRCASAPAPMSAARKPRCWKASKAAAASCAPSRRCRRIKGLFGKPTVINNVICRWRRSPSSCRKAPRPMPITAWAARAAPCRSSSPATSATAGCSRLRSA